MCTSFSELTSGFWTMFPRTDSTSAKCLQSRLPLQAFLKCADGSTENDYVGTWDISAFCFRNHMGERKHQHNTTSYPKPRLLDLNLTI